MITVLFQSKQWKYLSINNKEKLFLLSVLTAAYFVTYNNQTWNYLLQCNSVKQCQKWVSVREGIFHFPIHVFAFLFCTNSHKFCNFLSREAAMTVNFRLHWERALQLYLELLQMQFFLTRQEVNTRNIQKTHTLYCYERFMDELVKIQTGILRKLREELNLALRKWDKNYFLTK